jgi:tripartite-type tricarboxylate transporter receptor subunit TctC
MISTWTLVALAVLAAMSSPVLAADYPRHPIRLIVPQPAGGGTDYVARLLVPRLSESLGQQVIVDNRAGAGGIVGMEVAAKAAPDGYTLVMGYTGSLTINPNLHEHLPYRPVEDFDPISVAVASPFLLLVHPSMPANSLSELVAISRSAPTPLNYASPGNGSLHNLAMEWIRSATGARLAHIPYKGSQSLNAVVSGEVSLAFTSIITSAAQVKAGRVKALAITNKTRFRSLPDVPTVAESGIPGFEARNWFGMLTPHGTPAPITARLSSLVAAQMSAPEMKERLLNEGAEAIGSTPRAFADLISAELKRWKEVIRISGAKPV